MKALQLFIFLFGFLEFGGQVAAQSQDLEDPVFTFVEKEPTLKEGTLTDFIVKNIVYPKDAIERKIEGKVFVTFIVDTVGKVVDPKVLKGIGYGCDEEAVDVISETSGLWNPGEVKDKKVRVRLTVPISFLLVPPKTK